MKTLIIFLLGILIISLSFSGQKITESDLITKKFTYLALGDSYTIGEKVTIRERWPFQLTERLNRMGVMINDPMIIAKTGWTTEELIDGINKSGLSGAYDLVSVLIGVNNQYRGLSVEVYRSELKRLLKTAIKFANNKSERVFVLSIPDWGVMPFAEGRDRKKISEEIDFFNKIKKEETEKLGIRYFDITGISRMAVGDLSLIAADGLHPSGKMYRIWVERITDEVISVLKKVISE